MSKFHELTPPGTSLLQRTALSPAFATALRIVLTTELTCFLYVLTDTLKWVLAR